MLLPRGTGRGDARERQRVYVRVSEDAARIILHTLTISSGGIYSPPLLLLRGETRVLYFSKRTTWRISRESAKSEVSSSTPSKV